MSDSELADHLLHTMGKVEILSLKIENLESKVDILLNTIAGHSELLLTAFAKIKELEGSEEEQERKPDRY